ncbi:predicted protein [Candida tropicalis MYA-3404]|uniref:Uncharacterized protein n=1 Tax=Candida tropicalis (strain ATCC MYA-3404 / T1) TaxID=294747 RepID=C5M874_CANTT|nr:predicted protein [Candida tropicalis MYA-3404]EER33778.1 predicted protein [Candida tropicalis MYA-3404]KAG4407626.1 hypothetical protein JTP64_003161 [Candida tropicalis]
MDKSYDDLSAISSLVSTLNQRVNESAESIFKLQEISNVIVPHNSTTDKTTTDQPQDNCSSNNDNEDDDEEEDESSIIRKLEDERIALVMDIQKQDFVGEKLRELIDQNQEMLDSVKEYLQARESIQIEEDLYTKNDIEKFVHDIIQPTRIQLRENNQILHTKIERLAEKLMEIEQDIQREPTLLQSESYQKEVKYLVNAFKQLVKRD